MPEELLPVWLNEIVGLFEMAAIIVRALVVGPFDVPVIRVFRLHVSIVAGIATRETGTSACKKKGLMESEVSGKTVQNRALNYEAAGWEFEPLRVRHLTSSVN